MNEHLRSVEAPPAGKVRVGLIGVGGIGRAHLRALRSLPAADVVALCDINKAVVDRAAAQVHARAYTDPTRLLQQESLDAVYVCVPPARHGSIEIEAIRRGIHLYVEKPVQLDLKAALRIKEAVEDAQTLSQVGYGLRYSSAVVQLKELLAAEEVGTAHVQRWRGLPRTPEWWHRYDESGGQLVEMTTHQVDALRWMMGEVEAVSASYSRRLFRHHHRITIPDSQAVLLHFSSGASATVSTSCAVGTCRESFMQFVLRNSTVRLEGDDLRVAPGGVHELPPRRGDGPGITEAFVQAVADDDASLLRSPYADAVRTLAVTLAANRSAEEGGRLVRLKEMIS